MELPLWNSLSQDVAEDSENLPKEHWWSPKLAEKHQQHLQVGQRKTLAAVAIAVANTGWSSNRQFPVSLWEP